MTPAVNFVMALTKSFLVMASPPFLTLYDSASDFATKKASRWDALISE
jgi:hypothetical protein